MSVETYWDRYASGAVTKIGSVQDSVDKGFCWTQYDYHGPAEELLCQPDTTLELGCGSGNEVAYLARKGVEATGVDLSPAQLKHAAERWGDVEGARFLLREAVDYLTTTSETYDAIYSVWGAFWFTDPRRLLPAIRQRLSPRGVLVFSQAPAVDGCYGAQGMYGNGFNGKILPVQRWAYSEDMWRGILMNYGFTDVDAGIVEAPDPENLGTLIVQAKVSP
ncbi:class I SAM-dependent methyltransferase [Streptomyces sp. A3M-1-3]|uniref:class I SAM-dependent methyltransferase n=1 Tax=Streptomyces sp. A3M-1-3 TaxID=2962044 RepID=UPI0020B72ED3|nr:class I SAM-dependent methyltransferase [Streptomyces sp. A3M-1-3]MCP3820405.1 class I SAM-dependent methyltransferase [Streptomyces sp. A3M-1-3]